jgi:uncharacterized glyoxalase superfamily protein PhnB
MDIYPSLTYRDLEAALEFLEKAFGLEPEDLGTDEHGDLRHAVLRYGEGLVLLQPDLPDELHGPTSARDGCTSPSGTPTLTSNARRLPGHTFWESLTMLWEVCVGTARAIWRATFGASARIGPVDDLFARVDGVAQARCLRSLIHRR